MEMIPHEYNAISTESLINVTKHISLWLAQKTKNTRLAYKSDIEKFFEFHKGKTIDDIDTLAVSEFLVNLQESGAEPATMMRYRASISSLYKYLAKVKLVNINAVDGIEFKKVKDKTSMKQLSLDQVKRMIELESDQRNNLILVTLFKTGVRVSELCNLKRDSLRSDDDSCFLNIVGKGNKVRTIKIDHELYLNLKSMSGNGKSVHIFESRLGKKMSRQSIFNIVKEAGRRASVSGSVSPHWLRHSHANISLKNGADISFIQFTLGHDSISTTVKYLKVSPDQSTSLLIKI